MKYYVSVKSLEAEFSYVWSMIDCLFTFLTQERNNCLRECFDNLATLLHDKLLAFGLEPKIIVATNISLKLMEVIIF